MTQATLSVVIPNFNHGHYIKEAVESVMDQSFQPLEVILVDDASTDDSLAVAGELADLHSQVRVVKNESNLGAVPTTSRGIRHASGNYVYGMAADDRPMPGLFEKSMELVSRYPQAGLCSAMTHGMDGRGQGLGVRHTPIVSRSPSYLPPVACLALLRRHGSWFAGNTVVYRRSVLAELGGFDPELRSFADGFMCHVIALKYGACYIPEPLALERLSEDRYSKTIMANSGLALSNIDRATRLMRTTYRDLFPAEFVDSWSGRQRYLLGLRTVLTAQRQRTANLRKLASPSTFADKVFFALFRLVLRTEYMAVRLFLLASVKHRRGRGALEGDP